jgi:hypothetical protein
MSNCIQIDNGAVPFHCSVIDIPKLKALLESVKGLKEAPKDGPGYYAWWFLAGNVVFIEDHVVIGFGQSVRSTHTNRDFDNLINSTIKPLMKGPKVWVFRIRDECDGFKKVIREKVNFFNGIPQGPYTTLIRTGPLKITPISAPTE